jgi:hypothetical protein
MTRPNQITSADDGRRVLFAFVAQRPAAAEFVRSAHMKLLVAIFCVGASFTGAFGQGLINFVNDPSTLVSWNLSGYSRPVDGAPGSFYFGLLTSPVGANDFTFSGVYGTNQTVAGLFNGGTGVVVPGWAPSSARDFEVVGWAASVGHDFNPAWLTTPPYVGEMVAWGVSSIGTGVAGGITSSGTLPSLSIFGGPPSIQQGFNIDVSTLIPEPSGVVLMVLGTAGLFVFHRRGGPNNAMHTDSARTLRFQIGDHCRGAGDGERWTK